MDSFHQRYTRRVYYPVHSNIPLIPPDEAGRRSFSSRQGSTTRPISHSTPPPRKREGRSPASDCRVSPSVVASNLDDRRGHPTGARACAPQSTLAATPGWAAVILASRVYT